VKRCICCVTAGGKTRGRGGVGEFDWTTYTGEKDAEWTPGGMPNEGDDES